MEEGGQARPTVADLRTLPPQLHRGHAVTPMTLPDGRLGQVFILDGAHRRQPDYFVAIGKRRDGVEGFRAAMRLEMFEVE